ncbi:MAG: DUF3320 domain-containing protein [Burkholderiaceae bacterium]
MLESLTTHVTKADFQALVGYVLPGDRTVQSLRRRVRETLIADPAWRPGYISGRRDIVWASVVAACDEIKRLQLVYEPCAQYDPQMNNAVDINRRPGDVIAHQVANPAELGVLAAALLEALGLYPVLSQCRQSLFFGCWLGPLRATTTLVTDPLKIRQLVNAQQLVLIDPTGLFGADDIVIRSAADAAARYLADDNSYSVRLADVAASRAAAGTSLRVDETSDEYVIPGAGYREKTNSEAAEPEPDFEAPVPDRAALTSLAVAINHPRSQADYSRLANLSGIARPAASKFKRSLTCLLPADGEQRLIAKAALGQESFCVICPPGTGGSQSAANLIAQLLSDGLTVMHVSRSEVVRSAVVNHIRLAGISALCDTDGTQKTATAENTATAFTAENTDTPAPDIAQARAELAIIQRQRLDYSERLRAHSRSPWSLHYALGVCALNPGDWQNVVNWSALNPDDLPTPAQLAEIDSQLHQSTTGHSDKANASLAVIGNIEWSGKWEETLIEAATRLKQLSDTLGQYAESFLQALGSLAKPVSRTHFIALRSLAEALPASSNIHLDLAAREDLSTVREALSRAIRLTDDFDSCERSLSCVYESDADTLLSLHDLVQWHEHAQHGSWLRRRLLNRKIRSQLKRVSKGTPDPATDVPLLQSMRQARMQLQDIHALVRFFPSHWAGINSDFLGMSERLEQAEHLASAITSLTSANSGDTYQVLKKLSVTAGSASSLQTLRQACANYRDAAKEHDSALEAFIAAAAPSQQLTGDDQTTWPRYLSALANGIVERRKDIKDWCAWHRSIRGSDTSGMGVLIDSIRVSKIPARQTADAVHYACARCWLEKHMNRNDPDLPDEVDGHLEMPNHHRRANDNYRTALARQLLGRRTGDSPKACVITSVDELSNRSDYGRRRFDVVVFGDAEQITVTETIQIMAYAERAIFIGDPMRPSSPPANELFDGMTGGLASSGVFQPALSLGLPLIQLRNDYAARSPVLIGQTNRIGPAVAVRPLVPVNTLQNSLQLTQVENGVWDVGDVRENRPEAERVVTEVLALLGEYSAGPANASPSISVVAMTNAQKIRITELLERACHNRPSLKSYLFSAGRRQISIRTAHEPARLDDIVFFSTTVAPAGHVTNEPVLDPFMGITGLQRLYNVVGSARERLHIVTSLGPEDLVAARSESDPAIERLEDLLSNAANQHLIAPDDDDSTNPATHEPHAQSPFNLAVHNAMSKLGWQVAIPTESFGAGVDLVVENPDDPGSVLAGIVTDSGYFAQRHPDVIRRDDCQERALIDAGWQLLQAWPLQWWVDRQTAEDRLHQQLTNLHRRWRHANRPDEGDRPQLGELPKFKRLSVVDIPFCDADALFDVAYTSMLQRVIQAVINQEGPIRHDILLRRVARLHQRNKMTPQIKARLESAIVGYRSTRDGDHIFLWPNQLTVDNIQFRPPASHVDKRQLAEIAPEELAAAARHFEINPDATNAARNFSRAIGLAYPPSKSMRIRLRTALSDGAR